MFASWFSHFKRSWVRRLGILVLCFVIWFVVSLCTTIKFFTETLDLDWNGPYESPTNATNPAQVHVDFVFRGFNPSTEEASFDFKVTNMEDDYAEITILINGEVHRVVSDALTKLPLTFTTDKLQDITTYPFDKYAKNLTIQAKRAKESISFDFSIKKANKEFIVDYKVTSEPGSTAKFTIYLRRPWFSFFISGFLFILMWLLALAMMNIAIDTIFYRRDMPAEFIAAAFSLVFALPSLREAQPGIPKLGCYIDHVGFLWCLLVISMAACGMLFTWAYRWKPDSHSKRFSRSAISFIKPEHHKPTTE